MASGSEVDVADGNADEAQRSRRKVRSSCFSLPAWSLQSPFVPDVVLPLGGTTLGRRLFDSIMRPFIYYVSRTQALVECLADGTANLLVTGLNRTGWRHSPGAAWVWLKQGKRKQLHVGHQICLDGNVHGQPADEAIFTVCCTHDAAPAERAPGITSEPYTGAPPSDRERAAAADDDDGDDGGDDGGGVDGGGVASGKVDGGGVDGHGTGGLPSFDAWLAEFEREHALELDVDQRRCVTLACRERRNVFYTGPGGVGKSLVTRAIIAYFKATMADWRSALAIVAPTGVAATHIGGTTLHSACGVGVVTFVGDFRRCWARKAQIRAWRVLLLDEASMASAEFLEHLFATLQAVREAGGEGDDGDSDDGEGEGGSEGGGKGDDVRASCAAAPCGREPLQVVVCCDFYQLPPIVHTLTPAEHRRCRPNTLAAGRATILVHTDRRKPHIEPPATPSGGGGGVRCAGCREEEYCLQRGLAFQSSVWWSLDLVPVVLRRVWRQSDAQTIAQLARVRDGTANESTVAWFNEHCAAPPLRQDADAPRPLLLAPTNEVADARNGQEMDALRARGVSETQFIAADLHEPYELRDARRKKEAVQRLRESDFFGGGGCLAEKVTRLCGASARARAASAQAQPAPTRTRPRRQRARPVVGRMRCPSYLSCRDWTPLPRVCAAASAYAAQPLLTAQPALAGTQVAAV